MLPTLDTSFSYALTTSTQDPSLTAGYGTASSGANSTSYTNVTNTSGSTSVANPTPAPFPNSTITVNASSTVQGVTAYGNGTISTTVKGVSMKFYFDPNAPKQITSTSSPITITVQSDDLSGNQITGMWAELHDSNGNVLSQGYTPISFSANAGTQYIVYVSDWQNITFNHWDDSSTNPYRTITPTQSVTLTAYYSTGSTATAPQPPTNLAAVAVSPSQVNLSWTAPVNNGGSSITGYKIERSTDTGATWSTAVSSTQSTSTTYSDVGLASNMTYTYRVSAINSVGTSSPSNTASATTTSTTHAITKIQSGLVASDSLTNETMTQQQLQSNSGYWFYGGDAPFEHAPYSFYRDTQGLHIGVKAPKGGTWAGFFAESPKHGASLWHAVITEPARTVPTDNYENGLYVQTSTNTVNYVTCVALTNNQATVWALISTKGNFNQATSFTILWMDSSSNQPLTRDCTIITNGSNYLKMYLDGTIAYSSTSLSLQMPAPFNAYLEPETSYAGQMLTGTFTDYYVTSDETIKVINLPSSAARVDIVDQSGITVSSGPVSGGNAVLDVGKCHFPLGSTIKVYDSANSVIASSPAAVYGGDTYSWS